MFHTSLFCYEDLHKSGPLEKLRSLGMRPLGKHRQRGFDVLYAPAINQIFETVERHIPRCKDVPCTVLRNACARNTERRLAVQHEYGAEQGLVGIGVRVDLHDLHTEFWAELARLGKIIFQRHGLILLSPSQLLMV